MSIKRSRLSQEESRSAAIEAARALLLADGPQAVTLKAVAAKVGRTHANLLHHFGSAAHNFVSISSSIASQVPPAAGNAMAQKALGVDEITVCTFGDGATSEGDWHAGMNMAGAAQAPCLFVCENNQWAISTPASRQTASVTFAIKALAYGMPGVRVDGNDVLAVYAATREAVDRARGGGGPTLRSGGDGRRRWQRGHS